MLFPFIVEALQVLLDVRSNVGLPVLQPTQDVLRSDLERCEQRTLVADRCCDYVEQGKSRFTLEGRPREPLNREHNRNEGVGLFPWALTIDLKVL